MNIPVEKLKRIGSIALETMLGVFLFAIMLDAWAARQVRASEPTSPPAAESLLPVQGTVFDCCVQDDTNRAILLFNSVTGDYLFTDCASFSLSGTGVVRVKGCTKSLVDEKPDRRVTGMVSACNKKGKASAQVIPGGPTRTITDRNTTDNTCFCGRGQPD